MKDKAHQDVQKTECCTGGECCSSSPTDGKQQNRNKKQWWKIAVLAVGILLIVAATAYSLITKANAASNGLLGQGTVPSIATNTSAPARMGLSSLTWVQNLDSLLAKNDVVFVILPEEGGSNTAVTTQVSGAAQKIREQGVSVYIMTLSPSNHEFLTTTQKLGIPQFPAALILSKNGNGAIVFGNFNETKLLEAYVVVSNPTCAPGSSSGCCPK